MAATRFDVAVVGAGPVGLLAALAFARAGFRTCLAGPEPAPADGRTAALLAPSVALLEEQGLWAGLSQDAGALRTLRIVDDTGSLFRPPPASFEAAEIGLEAFGWNVENARLAHTLECALRSAQGAERRTGFVTGFAPGEPPRLRMEDGTEVAADLLVAADGRRSRLREAAGIAAREHRYPQTAFTTILRHERPHGDASTEFHTRAGPFTLVPLPGRRSSLVWVTVPQHARRLLAATRDDLARAVEIASGSLLGLIEADGPRGAVPLASMTTDRMAAAPVALIGEAAHVLPPIGAQGLNLGFADVAALLDAAVTARREGRPLGGEVALAAYDRARRGDVRLRAAAVDGLNRALLSAFLPLDAARGLGLGLLAEIGPLRRFVMRAGLTGTARPAPSPS